LVTPRSASNADPGFDVIDVPESACIVCGAVPRPAVASARKSAARWDSSTGDAIQSGVVPRTDIDQHVRVVVPAHPAHTLVCIVVESAPRPLIAVENVCPAR